MDFVNLPDVQTSVSTYECMRLGGGRNGTHGPVTSPAQIEVVTRRTLVPVALDLRITRRATTQTFPALLCILQVSGHTIAQESRRDVPTSSHPLCVQLCSIYACRSRPFCEGAVLLHLESANSASSGDVPGPGDAPGVALNWSECCTP